jgi:hypothetical protein
MDESVDLEVGRRIFRELFSIGVREIEICAVETLWAYIVLVMMKL